jgi:transposase
MLEAKAELPTMAPEIERISEANMVGKERWEQIRQLRFEQRLGLSQIARQLDLDRKTVRRCLRQSTWQPYKRAAMEETLLTAHEDFLRDRAPEVQYSARILYQELRRDRQYGGSYETVKRFVAPLRELHAQAELTQTRFETPPGQQSQIDWGQSLVPFRAGTRTVHFFVLTLGFSRRAFYDAAADERMTQLLEAHERAFDHFGGHTQEHLYDRPRTICYPDGSGRVVWNPTFKAFADYWGFEPRVCRAYRARTKGKVESGVKYLKRNFLPGRSFVDIVDLAEQLTEWNITIADQRIHGTTHEPPAMRFERERTALIPRASQAAFFQAARRSRIVASDYLVSVDTNRYSVPFNLIGQTVEVQRQGETVSIYHRDRLVAEHMIVEGQHQLRILPEHGPGAIARKARASSTVRRSARSSLLEEVEVRDLAMYDLLSTSAPVTP